MTRHSTWIALVAFACVAVAGVMLRPALPVDETRYLSVAWEMWVRGDWLVPTRNFEIYTHKPPILFWTINLVWILTGVSETAARLVGPGYALLALLLTGRLARMLWPDDPGIGGRAVFALAGLLAFAAFGGLTMFDAALAAATVAGVIALVRAVDGGRPIWWAGLGVAIAAGSLIKGPVILVHLIPAALLAPLWARGRVEVTWARTLRGIGLAILTALALIALWLVPAIGSGGPEYRDAILWTQSAGRITRSFAHARPWWFLAALLPLALFPWILVPAVWRAAVRQNWRDPALRLCLCWAATALVLFSLISGKQAHYLVPELPAVALMVAKLVPGRFGVAVPGLVVGACALSGLGVAAGLVPLGRAGALVEPRAMLVGWSFMMIAVAWIAWRARGLAGGVILTLGVLLAVNLLFGMTDARRSYDAHRIADAIAPYAEDGIAFYGQKYQAEFNFAGRLRAAVANPRTEAELSAWRAGHPRGIVIARRDRDHPDWKADRQISYRNAPFALWRVVDAPRLEFS